ncbi:Transporter, LysE family protein [Idiomarina baltica OS145]|jgi:RhtB (resistance to homoserine/threonine) family protein|uniref:Transporter, LysE family protein n=1 Tax=Idiomarina baltica OS145 TaxID=314276 RepID=A0ABP2CNV3_9GAMM|nr:Transporter, LysE family protein [Idiomarina baltica OS145]|tara:strand:+ start:372 stop:1034 length:663 start_codon:yes stop_codon:yes gene_type:complete
MEAQVVSYWAEFITIATYHLLAVASPGPDFAVVTRYSLSYGRKIGAFVSLGVAAGIILHVTYSLVGVAIIIKQTQWLYAAILTAGALYLAYMGVGALQSKPKPAPDTHEHDPQRPSERRAFMTGFITNGLNVKATLFFLTLFTVVISPDTPFAWQLSYAIYLILATGVWFLFLSRVLSSERVFKRVWRYMHWVDRLMGVLLIALAVHLFIDVLSELKIIV